MSDQETGLYYLQSRYYNPTWGRFLNADTFVSTGQGPLGNNMFAYCRNNPVKRTDASGTDDICVTSNEDNNPFNDMGPVSGSGGAGGGGNIWGAFTRTLQSAADGLNMAMGQRNMAHVEQHHMFSNKNQQYTPQFKEIADRYDYSLNSQENIVALAGHSGRHTNAYHDTMLFYMTELDAIAAGNSDLFMTGIGIISSFLKDNPWLPYAKYK